MRETKIRVIAGVNSLDEIIFVANSNPTNYINVRLTDGTDFYTATSSGGGGATTTINMGSYGGTATTLGQKAMAASMPVVLPNNQTVAVNVSNFSDNAFSNTSNIGSYGGTATTLGQKSMAASIPMTIASDQTKLPISIASDGVGLATQATLVDIKNVTDKLDGALKTPNDGDAARFIVIGGTFNDSSPTVATGDPRVISFRMTNNRAMHVTLRDNTSNQLIGQKAMSGSLPVTIASDQTPLSVNSSQSGAWFVTANVSNTINANVTAAQSIPSNFQNTTNVNSWGGVATSLGSKPMTASLPVVLASDHGTIDTNIGRYGGTTTSLGRKAMSASMPVTIASDQGSFAVTATVTNTVTVTQSVATNFAAQIDNASWGGTATTLGQKAMSASVPVTVASDQTLAVTNVSNATVYQSVQSNLNARNWAAHSSVSTLTALQTTFDNNLSTASSAAVTVTGYRVGLFTGIASSSGTPTDITFSAEFLAQNETDWMPYLVGPWGKFVFEDVALASGKSFAMPIPLEGNDSIRFTVVATGLSSANKFSLQKMRFQTRT